MFLLGTAEVFADNSSQTLLPMLVARDDLALANSRLQTGFITVNQLAGPPLGAALFAVGRRLGRSGRRPSLVALGAVLVSRVVAAAARPRARRGTHLGTTSPRASAGCGTTPRSGPWC